MRAPIIAGLLVVVFGVSASAADRGAVADGSFTTHQFRLVDGTVMPQVTIAYETYGKLSPDGRNAVLIEHGFTSSHHAAGRNPANGNRRGWWNGLIGPGKAIDTDRLYVVSSNMLGSSFGSTNGASRNPATGKPYGPDFPAITVRDMVTAQKALLDSLGVKHLRALIGFNTVPDFPKIKAKVLYVLSRSDPIFQPTILRAKVMGDLKNAGVDARYFEIDSDFGHLSAFRDQQKMAPSLRAFLTSLIARDAPGHRSKQSTADHADAGGAASR